MSFPDYRLPSQSTKKDIDVEEEDIKSSATRSSTTKSSTTKKGSRWAPDEDAEAVIDIGSNETRSKSKRHISERKGAPPEEEIVSAYNVMSAVDSVAIYLRSTRTTSS